MASLTNEEKESALLMRILQVDFEGENKPPVVKLPSLGTELSGMGKRPLLSMERIDDVFIERLSMSDSTTLNAQLLLLTKWIERVDTELNKSNSSADAKNVCTSLISVIERYISTVVNYPDVFGQPSRTLTRSGEIVASMLTQNELGVLLVIKICDIVAAEEGIDSAVDFASPIILGIVQRIITTRSFDICGDQASGDINTLALFLKISKSLYTAQILIKSQLFMPASLPSPARLPTRNNQPAPPAPTHKNVFILQTSTLIGRLLMPSTIDHVLLPQSEVATKSARHVNFDNLTRRSLPDFNASISQVRAQLGSVVDTILSIIQPLIRANEESRLAVLKWFAVAIKNSSSRATIGWQNQVAPHGAQLAEHLVSPQAMQQLNGSLERFRMFTNLQSVQFNGLISSGTSLNLAWTIFELCKPIKLNNCGGVDEFFLISQNPIATEIGAALASESRLGDSDRIKSIISNMSSSPGAFKTQIFWLAVNALHVLVLPSCKEAEMAINVASVFHRDKREGPMNDAYGEFHCFESIYNHPRFVESLAHVLNLMLVMILKCATGESGEGPTPSAPFESMDIRHESSDTLSDSMAVLPSCMMEEIVELLDFYRLMRDVAGNGPGARHFTDIVNLLDPDLFLLFMIWTLGSDKIKNPNIRGKAAKVLKSLVNEPRFSSRIERAPYSVRNIIPACIRVFCAVEKTKQSYYDIRMHVKFELRIPIQQLFEILLNSEDHRRELVSFVSEFRDDFYKFASQLLNDTTYLLEEGLDTLIAIRKRENEPEDEPAVSSADGTAGLGVERQVEEDDQNEQGQDIYRRSRHDPKEHCKQYMRMGHQTMSTLHQMCKQTSQILVNDKVVIEQMITSCLDPSLDRLVGPKCLQLKGEKSKYDFALFEFDPKKLLYQILEMYVFLSRGSTEKIAKILSEDQRYYRPETLRKAINIARREHLITPEILKEFEDFAKFTNEFATELKNVMDSVTVPDEFLDPIMAEIMVDPVLLPTSHNIMDRKHIMRIILSDDHDPFNRQPLKPTDLVPQDELRERIHAFAKQHNIPLQDDNMDTM